MGRDRCAAQSANIRTSPLMAPGAPQHQHGTDDDPRHMTSQCSQRSEYGASLTGSDSTGGCSAGTKSPVQQPSQCGREGAVQFTRRECDHFTHGRHHRVLPRAGG